MQVETYEETEVMEDGSIECESAAVDLIKELGLEGQQARIAGKQGEEKRSPYRMMTKEESVVYRALFPSEDYVKDYKSGMIPLRVLQVIAHAKSYYKSLTVWHRNDAPMKDPILVGYEDHKWGKPYILARWGEALESYEVMKLQAAKILLGTKMKKVVECEIKLNAFKASIAAMTPEQLAMSIDDSAPSIGGI